MPLSLETYSPRPPFVAFHERPQRWAAMVCHRRAGKTIACIADLVLAALATKRQEARYAYVAPLFVQAKDIAWSYLKNMAPIQTVAGLNESELRIDFKNGSRIRLYGAENADRLRGLYLDGVILDEYADMSPNVWGEIIRPLLSDREGWAVFIGTPKGKNEFHRLFQAAKKDPDWLTLEVRASTSGLISAKELAGAAAVMTPEQYAQEFECSFDAAVQGTYWAKELSALETAGRIREGLRDTALSVHTAWDLGVGDSTAIWCFQVSGREVRVVDYYENNGHGLEHYAGWLKERGYCGDDWVPHDAKVRELGTGRTRVETLQSMGRKPKLVPDHKLMDGINAVRLTLPNVWFDERCRQGVEALKLYRSDWDEKARIFRDRPRHDWTSHAADAFRYLCMAWREVKAEHPKQDTNKNMVYYDPAKGMIMNYDVMDIIKRSKR